MTITAELLSEAFRRAGKYTEYIDVRGTSVELDGVWDFEEVVKQLHSLNPPKIEGLRDVYDEHGNIVARVKP